MTTDQYDILVIDPPWPQRKGGERKERANQTRSLDYKTMSVPNIFGLLDADIFSLAAETHTVFLWMIDKFLPEAEAEMRARNYKLHARMIWDKGNGVAPAFTVRYSHEYLGWFYKPKMLTIDPSTRGKYTTVFNAPGRQHSRKPDAPYEMIDALYPNLTKMDVFSREKRDGWRQFGDETEKF